MNSARPRWIALLALVALAAGCGQQSPPAGSHALPTPPRVADCEPGQPGGRLVLAATAAPLTFNPVFALDNASDQIVRQLFSVLVNYDFAKQEVIPGLAESWSVAPDGKTWTFRLRRGLRWSDGHPLTSADVLFTWNDVIYNPRTRAPLAPVFRLNGKGFAVSAPDEHTVVVVTPEVFAPFLEFFGSLPVLPAHILAGIARQGDFIEAYALETRPDRIVGSGPFRLKECRPGQSTRLERNPAYWATDRTGRRLPYLDELEIFVVGNPAAQIDRFVTGRSDLCERIRAEDFERVQSAVSSNRVRWLELGPGADRDLLWFNQNTNVNRISGQPFVAPHKLAWFRNTAFRQAVSCAINRERLVREVYRGRAVPCETYLGAESGRWNNPNVPRFSYNLDRARALLAQAGLQDRNGDGIAEDASGQECEVRLQSNTGNAVREQVATLIVDDLRQIGIKMTLQLVPFAALERKINDEFDYESVLIGLSGAGTDPASHLNVLKSGEPLHQWFPNQTQPASGWEARLDALMDAQMQTLDFAARKRAFDEVQGILAEQLPMIYTVTPLRYAAARPGLENLRPALLSPYPLTWNAEELWLRAK